MIRTRTYWIGATVLGGIGIVLGIVLAYAGYTQPPREKAFSIDEPDMERLAVAERIGGVLGWDEQRERRFASTYAQIQWDALNDILPGVFAETHGLSEDEQRTFLTHAIEYIDPPYDFLGTVHATGTYAVPVGATDAVIADRLVSRLEETHGADLAAYITRHWDTESADQVVALVRGEREMLPDLVPLPPRDLVLTETKNGVLLSFSTIYYNQGDGPLELRADPATTDIPGDVERNVFQRIYREDGTHRDRQAGTFLWHAPHLHYHFADFVVYDLAPIDAEGAPDLTGTAQKSTFCIRDVSRVSLSLTNTPEDAAYKICGRERQGISVGWGDTYFYTYPDQNLNVSGLPSGTYRLSFIVNPEDRFIETTKANNRSSALIELDMEAGTVAVLEEEPTDAPTVEHVYEEQVFK